MYSLLHINGESFYVHELHASVNVVRFIMMSPSDTDPSLPTHHNQRLKTFKLTG